MEGWDPRVKWATLAGKECNRRSIRVITHHLTPFWRQNLRIHSVMINCEEIQVMTGELNEKQFSLENVFSIVMTFRGLRPFYFELERAVSWAWTLHQLLWIR